MKHPLPASLRTRLVRHLLLLQATLLTVFALVIVATLMATGLLLHQRDEERVIAVVQNAIGRDSNGELLLRPTTELLELRAESGLWFQVRDREGHDLVEGSVPPEFALIGNALDGIGQAKLGFEQAQDKPTRRSAQMKRVDTRAGNVQIIATTDSKVSGFKSFLQAAGLFLGITLPGALLMALATLLATPRVVERALTGLNDAAHQAEKIDIDKRGTRLPVATVPDELLPLVNAMNDALGRLDEGFDRHRRFLADAAHELRTPIAILTTRLESLTDGIEKRRLIEDVARLATLTEQLLDLQRLDNHLAELALVNLVALGEEVVADLAPMAIAAGYQISLKSEGRNITIWGDKSSLQRAVVNLVQNAIQHGGRQGKITVAIRWPATIEVADQGPGIPAADRERIFEPFHRVRPLTTGAGLGLHLAREIVRRHDGDMSVIDVPSMGACFRMTFPPIALPRELAS